MNGLYYVELCSLYTNFDESFCIECVLNFVKCFFYIYWDDHVIFILPSVNHVDWFAGTEPSLHPWNKYHLIMVYDSVTNSTSLLVISLFRLPISSWFSLGRLYVSRNLSISSRLSNLLVYDCSILLWFFVSLISVVISPLSFIWVLFFPWWAWLKVYQFCLPLQKTSSWFHWSFVLFSWSLFYLFPLWSLLFPSFCWSWGLLVLLFLTPLGGSLGCLFEIFLISWRRPVSL